MYFISRYLILKKASNLISKYLSYFKENNLVLTSFDECFSDLEQDDLS